ncbi:DNA polymerase III subunit delta [Candidatus Desulfarcum epimagneticum]|uniref:DNA polymerase III subunit delta n=1 Tax=uncultured Desulfobacteraceae bacterium TaxID=218296 RepID=A0A484HGC0_9BACT|nr:DNA polymerase III subunit delta [uncultured Desulfobacteraceae bacterium]
MAPGFKTILDQERPIAFLKAFLARGTLPHALLFTGMDGVGKRTCAQALAMSQNCLKDPGEREAFEPCGECPSCHKILSGVHPDVILVKRDGRFIKVGRIRVLGRSLSFKPLEAKRRFVLIPRAPDMNPEAGAALLKTLEEPSEKDVFILTAQSPSQLPPTLTSRCRHVRFNPVGLGAIAGLLTQKKGASPEKAEKIALMAEGSVGKAFHLSETDWIKRRDWLIHEAFSRDDRPLEISMALAERLSRRPDAVEECLGILMSISRDMMVAAHDPDKIVNRDMADLILKRAETVREDEALLNIEKIGEARKKINQNVNLRLALEEFWMDF